MLEALGVAARVPFTRFGLAKGVPPVMQFHRLIVRNRTLFPVESSAEIEECWSWLSEAAMGNRGIADGQSYGPEALSAMGAAFDAAWAEIQSAFSNGQATVALARLKLASAILSVADDASRDVQVLKRAALQAMTRDYQLQYSEGTRLAASVEP